MKHYGAGSNPRTEWARIKRAVDPHIDSLSTEIRKHQFVGYDGRPKMATPVISLPILRKIETILGSNYFNRDNAKKIEVETFHPKVGQLLEWRGYSVEHHFELRSGHIIDFLATSSEKIFIVECKLDLRGHQFFAAVGQVLSYRAEFGLHAIPLLACIHGNITEYEQAICIKLGIETLQVQP